MTKRRITISAFLVPQVRCLPVTPPNKPLTQQVFNYFLMSIFFHLLATPPPPCERTTLEIISWSPFCWLHTHRWLQNAAAALPARFSISHHLHPCTHSQKGPGCYQVKKVMYIYEASILPSVSIPVCHLHTAKSAWVWRACYTAML